MTRNALSGSVRRPPGRVALGLLVLLALGAGRPAPAAIVVQSMSVVNQVAFSSPPNIIEILAIGTTALGQQADMVNFNEPPLSAMLAFQTTVPDPVGTSFSVRSLTKATADFQRIGVIADADARFSIDFEVDATQDYLLFVAEDGFRGGGVRFTDLTASTILFVRALDDFQGEAFPFTLEAGHVYRFELEGNGNTFEVESTGRMMFVVRLNAVPEPSTWVGLGVAAAALLGTARRRRTSRITAKARARG